jgi:hypothetical protein
MALVDIDFVSLINKKKRHDGYAVTVDHAEDMAVHIYAAKPIKILERVRPREDAEVKQYRLESYEPITTATSDKAIVTVQKIMNPKLYTLAFPDSAKELEQYLRVNYPYYRDFMVYVKDVLIRAMIGDPNSIAMVIPLDLDIPDTEKARPIIDIVASEKLWDYQFAEWYLVHRKEEKIDNVVYNFFHYIDKQFIYYVRIKQEIDGKSTMLILSQYEHGIGEPPVWFLSGIITKVTHTGVLYRSFFSAALPYWNKAVSGDSDLDGAFVNHMHPIRVEQTEECGFVFEDSVCSGGQITRNGKQVQCPSCFGTGRKSVKSPYGVYQVPKPGLGEQPSGIEPVSFVSIPTEPTRMLDERVQKYLDKGLEALNMFFEVGENQSGIAKVLDRSELYDFLLTVSSVVFDIHIRNIVNYTANYLYMNKTADKVAVIQKPVSFDLLTVQEEAAALQAAQDANMNSTYIRAKSINLIQKDLFGKPLELAMATDALTLNTLSGFSAEQVIDMMNAGLVQEVDAIIFANINKIIQDLYAEYNDFATWTYEEKQEAVYEEAEEILFKQPKMTTTNES